MILGAGMGAGVDTASSTDNRDVAAEQGPSAEETAEQDDRIRAAEQDAAAAIAAAEESLADLEVRETELDEREAAIAAREEAVTATEERAAATQIDIGTWTVGVDVEPGSYRTVDAVTSTCYWGIYRTGTNKADIVDNDVVQGGYPSVTLREGQDFENGCGVWVKQ
ncbi:hypothetical protein [Cellulomonas bogoriensis]|uniref:Uncharacterized protein n=2 Tax=Cellulomonas bogoriensis TaxID=301388 RepID=A0A0A0BYT7_9CELL|nr:hypothetical protein N869_13000 [Cellulomonas bogoriensis 69B4 = DSM 16987]